MTKEISFSISKMYKFHEYNMYRLMNRYNVPIKTALQEAPQEALRRAIYIPQVVCLALSDYCTPQPFLEMYSTPSTGTLLGVPDSRTKLNSKPNRAQRRAQQRQFRSWLKQFERSMKVSLPVGAEE